MHTVLYPSFANRCAMASPKPLVAPVTKHVRIIFVLCVCPNMENVSAVYMPIYFQRNYFLIFHFVFVCLWRGNSDKSVYCLSKSIVLVLRSLEVNKISSLKICEVINFALMEHMLNS